MIKVGVAKQKINPKLGALLAGYPRIREAKTIADDLEVTAIAISSEKETALFVSATLTCIGTEVTDEVRALIKEKFGISSTIVCATHTHSGPTMYHGWVPIDQAYKNEVFIPQTLLAIEQALANQQEAKVGIGRTESTVGINRRLLWEGEIVLDENPDGIFDKRMFVISFVSNDGKPICNIVSYPAHATSVRGDEDWFCITRDWPGVMVDALEKHSGAITAFFNGAEGDVAPRRPEGMTEGLEMKNKVGEIAATDAIRAYQSITEYKDVDLSIVDDTIKVPYDEIPSEEYARKKLEEYGDEAVGVKEKEKRKWLSVIEAHKHEIQTHKVLNQMVMGIGDIAFIPFPFEPFTQVALDLSKASPFEYTFIISNANGCNGYLPNESEIKKGGYEVWNFKNSGAYVLTDNADSEFIKEIVRLLNQIKK